MAAVCIGITLLALFTGGIHGTPLPQTGPNVTVQQLSDAMSQLVVKYMQLENSSKDLQEHNDKLTLFVEQLETKLAKEENNTLMCEKTLNDTIKNESVCSKTKTSFEIHIKRLDAELTQCINIKKSLQRNQIINHGVLNASKKAHADCKNKLAQLSDVRTKLELCKSIPAKFPATCKAWNDAGYMNDCKYMIDPDGPGGVDSFEVECVMNSHYSVPMILMHHDSEARMDAAPNKIVTQYGNVRNVVYQASISQIIAAISASSNCEQFIRIECCQSPLTGWDTWYSRDGTPMYYWGGATPGSGKCACGMTKTCYNPSHACNCDANDSVKRSDSGLLTDRSTLQVTKMAFGDYNDDIEVGYHTLGPLRCYDMETADCA